VLLFLALVLVKVALLFVFVMALFPADAAPVRKARPAVAAPRPAPVPVTAPRVRVVVTTSLGVITAEVDREHAPITAGNFLRYVDQKRFDGTVFYRAMKLGTDDAGNEQGLVQGGTQNDPKRILKPIAHEPTIVTGLKHLTGALSMARFAPGTATGDFSILVSPLPGLDADPTRPKAEEPEGYAVFGYVVDGMDVVRKIHMSSTSPTKGEGWMKGQMLDPVVRILTIRRLPEPAPPR
jgi:peptidyl-prolyl cis-trans isomerase A (cyclophilin A)